MKLFGSKQKRKAVGAVVQTARSGAEGQGYLDLRTPFFRPEFGIYDAVREAVPIIDSAIGKIIRLIGTFEVECDSEAAERALKDFLDNVPTGPCSKGITSFLAAYMDSLLMYGSAAGEMVIGESSGRLRALYNADIKGLEIKYGNSPFNPQLYTKGEGGCMKPLKYPERILLSAINPNSENPRGRSMLEGLPFVASLLLKIYKCIGSNWDRAGNIRYAVTYKPDYSTGECAPEQANELAEEWSKAMSDTSAVRDFVAVGDVSVKVIGSDSQILDSEIPVRQMLEQIIAKTGLPPFIFGLSWSSTERMSAQQADILTSELEYYRTVLNTVITSICREFLQREGMTADFKIIWTNISLQDEVELARARLYRAQAEKIEKENR